MSLFTCARHNCQVNCDVITNTWQSIVVLSAECWQTEWGTMSMCENCLFDRHLWARHVIYEIEWCMCWCDELFMRSLEGYYGVYLFIILTNTKIILSWAHKQFVTPTHTLSCINQTNWSRVILCHYRQDIQQCVHVCPNIKTIVFLP